MKSFILSILAAFVIAGSAMGSDTVNVSWTAPGDDGSVGTASFYTLRYSISEITALNFDDTILHQTAPTPVPLLAGTIQNVDIVGLLEGTRYWFAMKASDEVGNISIISNIVDTLTPSDTTAPGQIQILLGWVGPNPFQDQVTLGYILGREGDVKGDVFNILGRRVHRLEIGKRSAGYHEVTWRPSFLG